MSEITRRNILILEGDRDVSELFARAIEARRDCKCYLAEGEEEAFDLMHDIPFDLTLVDLGMAVEGDFGFLKKIARLFPEITIIVTAFLHQQEYLSRALSLGAHGHLFKPVKLDLFREKIDQFFLMKPGVVSREPLPSRGRRNEGTFRTREG
jgi:two-component system, CitB family, response regulator CitT